MPPLREEDAGTDGGSVDARTCTDVANDSANCGACGHSCFGDPCVGGACQPVVVASGLVGGFGVDVDDASVFWSDRAGRAVGRAPKNAADASPEILLAKPSPFAPADVRVDGPSLVVVSGAAGDGTASVFRIPLAGGAPIPLGNGCAPDGNGGLAVDAAYYYFTNPALGRVYRASKGSGDCADIVSGQPSPSSVVVDDTTVFFTNRPSPKTTSGLAKAPKAGGAATSVAPADIPAATGIGTDGTSLFVSAADGRILRVEKDGSGVVTLARDMSDATPVVADDAGLYWAASGDVWTADKKVGNPRRIASVQPDVVAVAADHDHVYWATKTAIVRVAK